MKSNGMGFGKAILCGALGGSQLDSVTEPERCPRSAGRRLLPGYLNRQRENGWFHDAQFVIRFPNRWNGKLVITGAPGIRKQYSTDPVISDWAVARGYAYAFTDKGNSGDLFYQDETQPGGVIAEWNSRVTQLTVAAKQAVRMRYGRQPDRTYMTGISNGGYLTRWALEHHPELYDGGVDWEGTLFTPNGPNLLTYLPTALKYFPTYRSTGSQAAHDAMIRAGFAPGSEFLWNDHYSEYWDLTQRTYRQLFDPSYSGPFQAGIPFCPSSTPFCDAEYDYASRPQAVHDAVGSVSLTGHIGKPLLTLHGTLDALLPIAVDSNVYTKLIQQAGSGALSRYYVIQDGNHVDGRYDLYGSRLRPILPCYRAAFVALEGWVERGQAPPASQLVPDPHTANVANECALAGAAAPSTGAGQSAASPGGGQSGPSPGGGARDRQACRSRRRFIIHVPRGTLSVRVAGRRLRVRHHTAWVDLRGAPRSTVRVTMLLRDGRRVQRVYHTCTHRRGRRQGVGHRRSESRGRA